MIYERIDISSVTKIGGKSFNIWFSLSGSHTVVREALLVVGGKLFESSVSLKYFRQKHVYCISFSKASSDASVCAEREYTLNNFCPSLVPPHVPWLWIIFSFKSFIADFHALFFFTPNSSFIPFQLTHFELI